MQSSVSFDSEPPHRARSSVPIVPVLTVTLTRPEVATFSDATEWVSLLNANQRDTPLVPFFSFAMPLAADESRRCGHFAYANLEVSRVAGTGTTEDSPVPTPLGRCTSALAGRFPGHCRARGVSRSARRRSQRAAFARPSGRSRYRAARARKSCSWRRSSRRAGHRSSAPLPPC